jgi:hypothetical protein
MTERSNVRPGALKASSKVSNIHCTARRSIDLFDHGGDMDASPLFSCLQPLAEMYYARVGITYMKSPLHKQPQLGQQGDPLRATRSRSRLVGD